ncbi:MAG TPA: response regulator transcription factor [Candidatus Limnocylindria bacterium]|nr:response regulator transcription factor [Candidatus Limnocylindria bacterium]
MTAEGPMTAEATGPTVLLVEDDEATRAELVRNLRGHGYRVAEAATAAAAMRAWEARRPDAVLLDLGLPDRDGLDVIRQIRKEGTVPIVVLSARGGEATKVEALERGADDYVTKPFSTAELHARIRAVLRRTGGAAADQGGVIRNGSLEVDTVRHAVRVDGAPVALVPREFQILAELVAHPGRLVTRGRLLRAVWGEAYSGEDHYVHVYVSQIRKKLAAADRTGGLADLLVAEPGVGYRVRNPP